MLSGLVVAPLATVEAIRACNDSAAKEASARQSVFSGKRTQMAAGFLRCGLARDGHRQESWFRGQKLIGVWFYVESAAHQAIRCSGMRMVPSLAAGAGAGVPLFSRRQENNSKVSALRGMVPSPTPKRDHGDPQAFRLRSAGLMVMVAGEGLEPP